MELLTMLDSEQFNAKAIRQQIKRTLLLVLPDR